ncbi:MAG: FG-GAP repeat protein [Candidatus Methanofastidiosum methylothiophilum]|uniref:FG-GAP repeat protein n=1 Tax=Candidatus Methanofastidiosum methylothiophilum TaxID=1705564 RepID=A0A150J1J5_9EURY|nr:MAG: FG-GAP repeat protein [Candidatus Methanofastidiosum methylthiophilus]KYC48411.1 MAG: FG-GAP repeat protein [Candidatus Methanofastidiosum methylthiophilus]KYC51077.1 MAG: FG-GAP repeat protein [Candidatus Methanofastidiosum methylthiophilus]
MGIYKIVSVVLTAFLVLNFFGVVFGNPNYIYPQDIRITDDIDYTNCVDVVDVNGDGKEDVLVANNGINKVYISTPVYGVDWPPSCIYNITNDSNESLHIHSGDLDGDGDIDVVVANNGTNYVYFNSIAGSPDIIHGNGSPAQRGNGTYWRRFPLIDAVNFPTDAQYSWSIHLADMDNDGDLDAVVGNNGTNYVYFNTTSGGIIHGDGTAAQRGNGETWRRFPLIASNLPNDPGDSRNTYSIAIGDLDGDGDMDVAVGNGYSMSGGVPQLDGVNYVYLNTTSGGIIKGNGTAAQRGNGETWTRYTIHAQPTNGVDFGNHNTTEILLGDMDKDGDLDIVYANEPFKSSEKSTWRVYISYNTTSGGIVTGNGSGAQQGAGTSWTPSAPLGALLTPSSSIALGDVDKDGDIDIALGHVDKSASACGGAKNQLFLNPLYKQTKWVKQDVGPPAAGTDQLNTYSLDFGDVNGDTWLDLVVGNFQIDGCAAQYNQYNKIYLNTYTSEGAADDSYTVCSGKCVNAYVLDNDFYKKKNPTIQSYTNPSFGTVTNQNTYLVYCANANYCGPDQFTYTVKDTGNIIYTATVYIDVLCSPDAVNDSVSTCGTKCVNVSVLDNDKNYSGSTLTLIGTPVNGTPRIVSGNRIEFCPTISSGTGSFDYNLSNGYCWDTATVTVTIEPSPVAVDDPNVTVCSGGCVNASVLDNDTDDDALAIKGITVSPTKGTATVSGGKIYYCANTGTSGTDTFDYNVSDGYCWDTATVTVTVINCTVVADNDTYTTNEDTCVNASVLQNDYDPEYPGLLTFWITDENVSGPSHGKNTNYGNYIIYCPDANWCGVDTFVYEIRDVNGSTDTATVTINVTCVEDGLVARDDNYTTTEDTCVNAIVLANDYDPDGLSFWITDANVSGPSHGYNINHSSYILYCPDANWCGVDTFVYEITDVNGSTAQATVTINVTCVNDGLIAVDDFNSTTVNVCIDINVSKNDYDPDGDLFWIDSFTQPTTTFGTVTLVDSKGMVRFCPGMNCGTADFNYTITDGEETDTAKVTITVPCPPVVANDDYNSTIDRFTPVDFNITDNDDGSGYKVKIVPGSITTPSFGSVTVLDVNGTISFDPKGYCGTATFDYNATNGFSYDVATVTVDVPCPPLTCPVAVNDYNKTVMNTCVILSLMDNDYDPNGDPIKVTDIKDPPHGVIEFIDYEKGIIKYCPDQYFCGTDFFEYTIVDEPRTTQDEPCTSTATVRIDVICEDKQEVPAVLLYPLVDIERLTLSGTGIDVILDGKVVSVLEVLPGTQNLTAQVENRGFVTQNDVMVRFEGLPTGVSYRLEPESQKIKAKSIGSYNIILTASPNTPAGTYDIKAIAYTRRGTLDTVELKVVIN